MAHTHVHTVISQPGAIRGNHRHVPAGEAWRFAFPPGTAHAFKNTGSGPMLLVSFNTEAHDPARADAEREELIAP
jgi:quercetin dioxygenase-like cupin family protein